jgi:hypothetical protein
LHQSCGKAIVVSVPSFFAAATKSAMAPVSPPEAGACVSVAAFGAHAASIETTSNHEKTWNNNVLVFILFSPL